MSSPRREDATGILDVESLCGGGRSGVNNETEDSLRYVHPETGILSSLAVQSLEDPQHFKPTTRWIRLGKPLPTKSVLLRVGNFVGSSVMESGHTEQRWSGSATGLVLLKLVIAWPLSCILVHGMEVVNLRSGNGVYMNQLHQHLQQGLPAQGYDALPIAANKVANGRVAARSRAVGFSEPHSPPRSPGSPNLGEQRSGNDIRLSSDLRREPTQDRSSTRRSDQGIIVEQPNPGAKSRPRYLCFVQDFEKGTYKVERVSEYIKTHDDHVDIEFIFVSYTRTQFRIASDAEIDAYDYPDEATREANRRVARRDRRTLIQWAIQATRAMDKMAFWIDFECVRDSDAVARSTSSSDDVYRICDVVRAAYSMIIALSPPASEKVTAALQGKENDPIALDVISWQRQWGSRLWTLPELLLCPREHKIKLYVLGDKGKLREVAKKNFAHDTWDDAENVKELMDHFEGTAILPPLQFTETALACFTSRKTDQFSQGDIAYAMMGLFPARQRPPVDKKDSAFQAFSRLALGNDGGEFLRRLLCILPSKRGAPWYDTHDAWGAKLTDIHPEVHVSKVERGDALLLDSAYATSIQWDGIHPAVHEGESAGGAAWLTLIVGITLVGMMSKMLLVESLLTEAIVKATRGRIAEIVRIAQVVAIIVAPAVLALFAPLLHVRSRRHLKRPLKAHIIGMEGRISAGVVERYIWGYNHGRLSEAPPDAHIQNGNATARETSTTVYNEEEEEEEETFFFTLLDTRMMTVTHVRTYRPPVAVIIAGQEGGAHRAMLCSYDWRRNVYIRETILKVPLQMPDEMTKVNGVRLSLDASAARNGERLGESAPACENGVMTEETTVDSALQGDIPRTGRLMIEIIFWVLVLMTLRIPALNISDQAWEMSGLTMLYCLSFIVSQGVAYGLLRYSPIPLVFPHLAHLKALSLIVPYICGPRSIVSPILGGLLDGMLLFYIITITASWFSPRALAFRFAIIATLGLPISRLMVLAPGDMGLRLLTSFYSILCILVGVWGGGKIGRPLEVFWLPAPERRKWHYQSAMGRFESVSKKRLSPMYKWVWAKDAEMFLVFGISFLSQPSSVISHGRFVSYGVMLEASLISVAAAIIVGVILSKISRPLLLPTMILTMAVSLLGAICRTERGSSPGLLVMSMIYMRRATLPYLWAAILSRKRPPLRHQVYLAASICGMMCGVLTSFSISLELNMVFYMTKKSVFVLVMVMNMVLVGLLWLKETINKRTERNLERRSAVQNEARFTDAET